MKKGECSDCGRPLFDQEKADPETQLCDIFLEAFISNAKIAFKYALYMHFINKNSQGLFISN